MDATMPRQRHELRVEHTLSQTFDALLAAAGKGRWARGFRLDDGDPLPRAGERYEQQRGSVLRRGRVLECIKPVSLTLHETLLDPPCCVRLRLRWRLEPVELGSHLRLEASFDLNGAATLRRRHWNARIDAHCGRMLGAVTVELAERSTEPDQGSGVKGQNNGNSSMTEAKITAVSGKPTLT
jgi:hypothetical protein